MKNATFWEVPKEGLAANSSEIALFGVTIRRNCASIAVRAKEECWSILGTNGDISQYSMSLC